MWFADGLRAPLIETPRAHVPQVTHLQALAETLRPILGKLAACQRFEAGSRHLVRIVVHAAAAASRAAAPGLRAACCTRDPIATSAAAYSSPSTEGAGMRGATTELGHLRAIDRGT
jgi:hypothetical protein